MPFGWFKPKPPTTCPGCGRELIEWTEWRDRSGYRVEMRWTTCPIYRELYQSHPALDEMTETWAEQARHAGSWSMGQREPLHRGDQ